MSCDSDRVKRLKEVAWVFFKLGSTSFGGPAAHTAVMEDEVVRRRRWLDREAFLDYVGASNLIPGPNSTELAIHLGYDRAGWPGLLAAGACFILPAMVIVWAIAAVYVRYQAVPEVGWLLYGVKPAIIAVVAQALWGLGKTALRDVPTGLTGGSVIVLALAGWNEMLLLPAAGLAVMLFGSWGRAPRGGAASFFVPLQGILSSSTGLTANLPSVTAAAAAVGGAESAAWPKIFWVFLKIGSVLYGSGYVLLAFLQGDLVERWGWLTSQQLLDAVAIGQFTPGPLFTTATFIGYLLGGGSGSVAATVGIFLPAFVLVWVTGPLIPKLRRSRLAGRFLDGVNAASLGLMAVVTWELGRAALVDWLTIAIAAASFLAVYRFRLNSAWLVLMGGLAGFLCRLAG